MTFEVGTKVKVKSFFDSTYQRAVIAGHYIRREDQLDSEGRFIIAPKGIVYQVRYAADMGIYNIHESYVSIA